MHIVGDMCKYGKPKAANTEVGENNHKVFAKRIGHHCRKQHKTYASQVAICLTEALFLRKWVLLWEFWMNGKSMNVMYHKK